MKHIKFVKHSHLSTENTEKQSMIYTKARIGRAKVHRDRLEKLNDACAAWGNKGKYFNLGPEIFVVDVDSLNMPATPKRY